jgi:hypothetical protein
MVKCALLCWQYCSGFPYALLLVDDVRRESRAAEAGAGAWVVPAIPPCCCLLLPDMLLLRSVSLENIMT